jgi:tetratricopeptide (TPR) repeat protein
MRDAMAVKYRLWPRIGILAMGLMLALNASPAVRAEEKESPLQKELLGLNNATTEEIQTKKLRALLKDRVKAKEAVAEAAKMMKETKGDTKPFTYNGTIILAKAAHILRMFDIAETFYKHQLDLATKVNSGTKIVNAYDGLIELYWDSKRYVDVIEKCEEVVEAKSPKELQSFQPFALELLIKAKAKQGKIDEALTLTKGLIVLDEDTAWYFLELRGWIQREDGKLNDAIATYQEALDKLDSSKTVKAEMKDKLKDQIHYIMSGLYVDNKEIDKAAKQLEGLMKRNPDAATYRNDLGFIWCDHDMKLEESEKLIKEALVLDKKEKEKLKADGKLDEVTDNAAYLDSLGWVYFKQKKYKEALDPLKKASEDQDEGNHMEIWDHLADCYMALGQKKDAVSSWEKALKMEDISNRDGERRRKVSDKLKKARLELSKVKD